MTSPGVLTVLTAELAAIGVGDECEGSSAVDERGVDLLAARLCPWHGLSSRDPSGRLKVPVTRTSPVAVTGATSGETLGGLRHDQRVGDRDRTRRARQQLIERRRKISTTGPVADGRTEEAGTEQRTDRLRRGRARHRHRHRRPPRTRRPPARRRQIATNGDASGVRASPQRPRAAARTARGTPASCCAQGNRGGRRTRQPGPGCREAEQGASPRRCPQAPSHCAGMPLSVRSPQRRSCSSETSGSAKRAERASSTGRSAAAGNANDGTMLPGRRHGRPRPRGDDGHGRRADASLLSRLPARERRDAEVDSRVRPPVAGGTTARQAARARRAGLPQDSRTGIGRMRARALGGVGRLWRDGGGVSATRARGPASTRARITGFEPGGPESRASACASGLALPAARVYSFLCSGRGDASQCIGRPRRERGTTHGCPRLTRSRQSVDEMARAGISS